MNKWKSNWLPNMSRPGDGIFIITNGEHRLICENPITKERVEEIIEALNRGEDIGQKEEEDE